MKKNYCLSFLIVCLLLPLFGFTQNAQNKHDKTSSKYKKIYIQDHGHDHPEPIGINKFFIDRPDFVKAKMASRNSTSCSNIIVTYNGFPTDGSGSPGEAQLAFQFAVEVWESLLVSDVPIRADVSFVSQASGTLGSASVDFFLAVDPLDPNKLFPAALGEKIIGEDADGPAGTSNDMTISLNSNRTDWYFGTDGNTPSNQIDFVTVALHELGHGLGLIGFGREVMGNQGAIRFDGSDYSVWDSFINGQDISMNKVPILNTSQFPDPSSQMLAQFESGNLTSFGPIAVQENGGNEPLIYAPSPFNTGSSYSHWDESTFNNTPHALMTPRAGTGEANHDPGTISLGFMEDMGWTLCQGSLLSTQEFVSEDLKITPNPFRDKITVDIPANFLANETLNVSIIDINGRTIVEQEATAGSGKISISDLSNLKPALYFMTLSNSDSGFSITRKIVKN